MKPEIDPNQPEFLPVEAAILHALLVKHDQYVSQKRTLEARAMQRAIQITWDTLKGDFDDTQPSEWVAL